MSHRNRDVATTLRLRLLGITLTWLFKLLQKEAEQFENRYNTPPIKWRHELAEDCTKGRGCLINPAHLKGRSYEAVNSAHTKATLAVAKPRRAAVLSFPR